MRALLDTNAVLRHLLADIPEQAQAATEAIEHGARIIPEVLCECVFVLSGKYYALERAVVSDALSELLSEVECERSQTMLRALRIYRDMKLDFVDCIMAASAEVEGCEVLTFDKKLSTLMKRRSSN